MNGPSRPASKPVKTYGNKNKAGGHRAPKKDGTGEFESMTRDLIASKPDESQIEHTRKLNDLEKFSKHNLTEEQRKKATDFELRLKATEEKLGNIEDEEEPPQDVNEFAGLSHLELLEKGRSKGYPTEINRDRFEERVKAHLKTAESILTCEVESPFYAKAKKYAETSPKRNINRITLAFDKMTPPKGYFGYKGVEYASLVLQTNLQQKLLETQKTTPWMKKFIIAPIVFELAVIPEIFVRLIAEDQNVPYDRACEILQESTPYGERVFHAGDEIKPKDSSSDDDSLAPSDSEDDMKFTVINEKPPPSKKQKTKQSTNSIVHELSD
ncbi:hypothetical protein TRICI_005354 [Trichomonascus ciferrii]|uniref:Restriction of telomere capping protein 4 n=1 Tax=Trichomonascus ciferrii TaxID=44093 RepID=A0A642UT64_9ASCO|nr:hypothetical protein TRICI_005354 [Trichomonascus ciferrii]